MELQGPFGGNGNTVAGTACMVPQQVSSGGGGGGGGGMGSAVDAVVSIVRDSVKFMYEHQRYIWLAYYNMRDVYRAERHLKYVLRDVHRTIVEAEKLGWEPSWTAVEWVQHGVDLVVEAANVVATFNEPPAPALLVFICLCRPDSRFRLTCDAVMIMNRIRRHIEDGKREGFVVQTTSILFDVVAIDPTRKPRPMTGHGQSALSKLAEIIADHRHVFFDEADGDGSAYLPAMLPLECRPSSRLQEDPITTTRHDVKVRLSTLPQVPAVPGRQSIDNFPVLVRVKAPRCTQHNRAPIDLVMVLDISAKMRIGSGLQQLKQAAEFAILNLRQDDRLSVVTFGPRAEQLSELTDMSNQEKRAAIMAVASLQARGGVGIKSGLKKAREVLHNRLETHRVGGIILLTDGKDTRILNDISREKYLQKSLEDSDRDIALRHRFPTYTFGFGTNHDPRTLFYIACEGYGTYSFADESLRNIEHAMALCIGGLTSIVAQEVNITVETAQPEVKISEVKRGLHEGSLTNDNNQATITIKDLFGEEEKNFIVYVNVPKEKGNNSTKLLTVTAEYRNPMIKDHKKKKIQVDKADVLVKRPQNILFQDSHISDCSSEVQTEIYRVDTLYHVWRICTNIAAAGNNSQYFTKAGVKCWDIQGIDKDLALGQLEELLRDVDPTVAKSADPDMAALRRKLYNDLTKMKNELTKDVVTALPYMLSWLTSHGWQRAATQVIANQSSFLTVRMQNMIASVDPALAKISRAEEDIV